MATASYARGDRIIFQWCSPDHPLSRSRDKAYLGVVESIHRDGTYTIRLDLHEMGLVVSPVNLRRV
jgi:hypothetical protein